MRFSSKFYERLGDDVAGELVDWCNVVDETYRNQPKEMNESFWERLKDHLDVSLGGTRSEMSTMRADLRNEMSTMRADLRNEMSTMGAGLRSEMSTMGAELRSEMSAMGAELRSEMSTMRADLRTEIANTRADLIKWMFVFWVGNVVTLGGLMVALLRLK